MIVSFMNSFLHPFPSFPLRDLTAWLEPRSWMVGWEPGMDVGRCLVSALVLRGSKDPRFRWWDFIWRAERKRVCHHLTPREFLGFSFLTVHLAACP